MTSNIKYKIKKTLFIYNIEKYKINDDLTVDVFEDVNLSKIGITNFSINFNNVYGNFICSFNRLTSLQGAPKFVKGDFDCSYCENLKSLKGSPEVVEGDFNCSYCYDLTSLQGAPKTVKGNFDCSFNKKLKSLKNSPFYIGKNFNCVECNLIYLNSSTEIVEYNFNCSYNKNLKNLKNGPKVVKNNYYCIACNLKKLNIDSKIDGIIFCNNNLLTLKEIKKINLINLLFSNKKYIY